MEDDGLLEKETRKMETWCPFKKKKSIICLSQPERSQHIILFWPLTEAPGLENA